ncbi:MAG TPA: DUF523 domain-containing protein [archaeon]|nr:DUF523 domain-containing protein [archaeon]
MEKLLVSACLLGVACRYDGSSLDETECKERVERLSKRYHPVPVCPEQTGGLPTPRNRMSFSLLPGDDPAKPYGEVLDAGGVDRTGALKAGGESCVKLARLLGVRRALLKERSPSCGVNAVYLREKKVKGEGIAARLLREAGIEAVSDENEQKLYGTIIAQR